MSRFSLSLVIPALNEERNLTRLLASLGDQEPLDIDVETIVVDNGSSDRTVEVARSYGARVLNAEGTVAALRNHGVSAANGPVVAFLDADVTITPAWAHRLDEVVGAIRAEDRLVTGAWYKVRPNASWIEVYWFKPLEEGPHSHINSGNLFVHRDSYLRLGGMDEALVTGEDYEFCARATREGMIVQEDPLLETIHWGYPKTLLEFWRREVWHGLGDCKDLASFVKSKVAVTAAAFTLSLLASLIAFLSMKFGYGAIYLGFAILVSGGASAMKFGGHGATTIVVNSFFFAVYFLARTYSVLTRLLGIKWRTRHDSS